MDTAQATVLTSHLKRPHSKIIELQLSFLIYVKDATEHFRPL